MIRLSLAAMFLFLFQLGLAHATTQAENSATDASSISRAP